MVGNEIDEIEGIFEHPNGANVEGPVTSMDRSNEVIHNELRKIRDFQVRHPITRVIHGQNSILTNGVALWSNS